MPGNRNAHQHYRPSYRNNSVVVPSHDRRDRSRDGLGDEAEMNKGEKNFKRVTKDFLFEGSISPEEQYLIDHQRTIKTIRIF